MKFKLVLSFLFTVQHPCYFYIWHIKFFSHCVLTLHLQTVTLCTISAFRLFFFLYAVCLVMVDGVKSCTTLGTHVASVEDEFYRSISSHLHSHFAITSCIPSVCFHRHNSALILSDAGYQHTALNIYLHTR